MDISALMEYVTENCLILIPALWVVGAILKATPKLPNWAIPYILTFLGVAGACCLVGLTISGVVQGVLVSGAAVLGHQLVKQAQESNKAE